jgi:oxygen-independent coproporphyrinogen III oxidase
MKLLAESPEKVNVERLIDDQVQGDYIYMYPPRQAYYPMPNGWLTGLVAESLEKTSALPLNLYLHYPFCRQICGFCNLYSVVARPGEPFAEYVDLLGREMRHYSALTEGRPIDTIYLGGGTPSILPVAELDRSLSLIEKTFLVDRRNVAEVAIEVAPDTVNKDRLKQFSDIGINRINLGLQTTSDASLHQIGRRHGFSAVSQVIYDAMNCGFDNVCIDLIYGLPQQTVDQWRTIVDDALAFRAPTICAYPLTLRPNTGFAHRTIQLSGSAQYLKYEIARQKFGDAGYTQETHVRYIEPAKGGYRQKQNHWAGQDVLGIGAGARGYLRDCDYRNGYSIRRRRDALDAYYEQASGGEWVAMSGFYLNTDERMRRRVILGLLALNRDHFRTEFAVDVVDVFSEQFDCLKRLDLVVIDQDRIYLTDRGRKYRDLIVQLFFSGEVWKRIADFDYME